MSGLLHQHLLLTVVAAACMLHPGSDARWIGMNGISVSENVADIVIFNATYTEDDTGCDRPEITVSPPESFNVSQPEEEPLGTYTVQVMLIKPLDSEKDNTVIFTLTATVNCGGSTPKEVPSTYTITVIDVMDSAPEFSTDTYSVDISEVTPVGTTIIDDIGATEKDDNDYFTYAVEFSPADIGLFSWKIDLESRKVVIGLNASLDYETATRHSFTVIATDSNGLNGTCDVVVNVLNELDTPPKFSLPEYFATVTENVDPGTSITQVTAHDVDQIGGAKSQTIRYVIQEGGAGMFVIDNVTGVVRTQNYPNAEDPAVRDGVITMTIAAEEETMPNITHYGETTATVKLHVIVVDIDDNVPTFNTQTLSGSTPTFSGSISEFAVNGDVITLDGAGYITVDDDDRAVDNSEFSIQIERNGRAWDVFKPSIETARGHVSLLLVLQREEALRELADTEITFQIVARSVGTSIRNTRSTRTTSSADITLTVRDTGPSALVASSGSDDTTLEIIVYILVVFVIINIAVTVYILCRFRRDKKSEQSPFFTRNSKYYVSKKKDEAVPQIQAGEAGRDSTVGVADERNQIPEVMSTNAQRTQATRTVSGTYEAYESKSIVQNPLSVVDKRMTDRAFLLGKSSSLESPSASTRNTITTAAERNRCDVTLLANKPVHDSIVDTTVMGKDDIQPALSTTSVMVPPQDDLIDLLGRSNSNRRCDVTSLQTKSREKEHTKSSYVNISKPSEERDNVSLVSQSRSYVVPLDQSPFSTKQPLNIEPREQKVANAKPETPLSNNANETQCDLVPFADTISNRSLSRDSSFSSKSNSTDKAPLIKLTKEEDPIAFRNEGGQERPGFQGYSNPAFERPRNNKADNRPNQTAQPKGIDNLATGMSICNDGIKYRLSTTPVLYQIDESLTGSDASGGRGDASTLVRRPAPAIPTSNTTTSQFKHDPLTPDTGTKAPDHAAHKHKLGPGTPMSQLSKPDVPPVALALPSFSTGHTQPPQSDEYIVVTNPVYEPYYTRAPITPDDIQSNCSETQYQNNQIPHTIDLKRKAEKDIPPHYNYITKAKSLLSEAAAVPIDEASIRTEPNNRKSVTIVENDDDNSYVKEQHSDKLTRF